MAKIKMSELKKIIKEELDNAMQAAKGDLGTVQNLIQAAPMYFKNGVKSMRMLDDNVTRDLKLKAVDGATMANQPGRAGSLEKGLKPEDVVFIVAADGIKTVAYVPKSEATGLMY